jgi:hypothetical protein
MEKTELIWRARGGNEWIPKLLKKNEVFLPRDPIKNAITRAWILRAAPRIEVSGAENIDKAEELLEQGYELTVASNHRSDADHTIKRRAFEQIGHTKFADRQFFPSGVKMLIRSATRILMGAEHAVHVVPPHDSQAAREYLRQLGNQDFLTSKESEEHDILNRYLQNSELLNNEAMRISQELIGVGLVPSVYPEGGRSISKYLADAPREVSVYFKNREGWTLPIATKGIEEAFPPRENIKIGFSLFGVKKVEVVIGKPIENYQLWEKSKSFFGNRGNPAEVIMAEIGALDPGLIHPEKLGYYNALLTVINKN